MDEFKADGKPFLARYPVIVDAFATVFADAFQHAAVAVRERAG